MKRRRCTKVTCIPGYKELVQCARWSDSRHFLCKEHAEKYEQELNSHGIT